MNTFELIKAVSDTILDMINVAYHKKPLVFIWEIYRTKFNRKPGFH